MNLEVSNENIMLLQKSFFEEKGLVRQHLDSYDKFIDQGLQQIIDQVGEIEIEVPEYPYKIKLGKVWVLHPQSRISGPYITEVDGYSHDIYPIEARFRNLTYAAPLSLEITPVIGGRELETELVLIGDLPVMLKSKLCVLSQLNPKELVGHGEDPNDPGGYFVVNGSERVIVALEDLAPNRILVDVDTRGARPVYQAKIFSSTVGFRARIELRVKSDGAIYVSMPGVPSEISFVILMRALGLESDKEIAEAVSPDNIIQNELEDSFEKAMGVDSVEDAIMYIGSRVAHGQVEDYRRQKAENILDRNFLPHIGRIVGDRGEKALFLGEMACRALELKLRKRKPDDKDHFKNKRLKLAGPLLADLFRVAFRNLCRDIKYQLERMGVKRQTISVSAAVRPGIITERLRHAIATGNWGRGRVGITQLLDRTNHISALSHLRRLQSPLSRSQPNFEARDLHPTHWGRLCPNETPEGSNCGLVKNLALAASISVRVSSERIRQILYRMDVIPAKDATKKLWSIGAKVFVDGRLVGYCMSPHDLVAGVRNKRRSGEISADINVAYISKIYGERDEIYVNSDEGRVRRPLIVLQEGIPNLQQEHFEKIRSGEWSWEDLVKEGIIEYIDAEEEENLFVALNFQETTPEHTHVEIATFTVLGICASLIPYAEHNQSPRNSYEAAMSKQALGIPATNYPLRVDSRSHILHYP